VGVNKPKPAHRERSKQLALVRVRTREVAGTNRDPNREISSSIPARGSEKENRKKEGGEEEVE